MKVMTGMVARPPEVVILVMTQEFAADAKNFIIRIVTLVNSVASIKNTKKDTGKYQCR